jgi:hypothetical protein
MFQILIENILLTIIIITLITLSIIFQIVIGALYQKLINESENLSSTENKHLKLCKLKFQNCYQLNGNVPNIAVFVDKFINRLILFRMTLGGIRRLSSQLVMLAVFVAGVGICLGIITGETMFRLLPYYLLAIVGLYIYFSVAALVDLPSRRETLKINLMDYLENHMLYRLRNNLPESGNAEIKGDESQNEPVKERDIGANSNIVLMPIDKREKPSEEPAMSEAIAQFSADEIEELLQELIV